MSNNRRIFGALILNAIYFFALGFVSYSINYSDILKISAPIQELVYSNFSETVFYDSQKSESSVSCYNNLPSQWFKNHFSGFWACEKVIDKLFAIAISNYLTQYKNILLSYEEIDIIYPAHYFW